MGEARLDAGAAGHLPTAAAHTFYRPAFGTNLMGKRAAVRAQIRYQPGEAPLSKHCHLNHVAAGGGYANFFQPKKSCACFLFRQSDIIVQSRGLENQIRKQPLKILHA